MLWIKVSARCYIGRLPWILLEICSPNPKSFQRICTWNQNGCKHTVWSYCLPCMVVTWWSTFFQAVWYFTFFKVVKDIFWTEDNHFADIFNFIILTKSKSKQKKKLDCISHTLSQVYRWNCPINELAWTRNKRQPSIIVFFALDQMNNTTGVSTP